MADNMRWQLFLNESIMFLIIQAIGLYVGYWFFLQRTIIPAETASSIFTFLVSFAVATAGLILLLKFFKTRIFFKFLLAFLIFVGAETVFLTFVPEEAAILLAIELVILRFMWPNVFSQNLALIFAVAGISATLGLFFSFEAVLVILAVLSVYDVIAVYRTQHMITLFKGLLEKGVPFSIIVPDRAGDVKAHVKEAQPGTGRFLLLGTGDIAFPIVFAVAALKFGVLTSISVIFGAFVGLFFIHLILMQKKIGAIPALPPIVFFSLIAFVISLFVF